MSKQTSRQADASAYRPADASAQPGPPLLDVHDLTVAYGADEQAVVAVRAISFTLQHGAVLGLVGESGCGKTTMALTLLRLLRPPARVVQGRIGFRGADLLRLPDRDMEQLRGNRISLIFQNPMTSLNPTYTIGAQIVEAIRAHRRIGGAEAWARATELMAMVGIPDGAERLRAYPHELSGGQRQRAIIAMAIALEPDLVIADEPTTALDVTIQAQILGLLIDLKQRLGMSMIYITHDLNVAASICDQIAVIYAGEIVEIAQASQILGDPSHPYTRGLVASLPETSWRERMVHPIKGHPPIYGRTLTHCPFTPRCAEVIDRCRQEHPALLPLGAEHAVRCLRRGEREADDGAP